MNLENSQLFLLLRSLRPRQWIKNLAVFAVLIFNGLLLDYQKLVLSLISFLVFCLLSSTAYLINDLHDLKRDQTHPFKRKRPIASGKLSKKKAFLSAALFFIIALLISFIASKKLLLIALAFSLLQFSYTFIFKKIPVVDVLVIAGAYILRVYVGEVVIGSHLSVWLMLSVVSLALFLAIGKRKAELALLSADEKISIAKTRASLIRYKAPLLDVYLSLFATSTWITYGFYTFSEPLSSSKHRLIKKIIPGIVVFGEKKWLMLSIPFVLYGIMRYLQLIYEYGYGEAPEKLLFLDKSLLLTVIGWGFSVILAIYLI